MSYKHYLAWAFRFAAVALLFAAEPVINTFGKDPYTQRLCLREVAKAKDYIEASPDDRRWMRADCHRNSLLDPFRFAYDITGFPSAE